MKNEIIIGRTGTGKLVNYVALAIRIHNGPVLWIHCVDEIETLRLDNIMDGERKAHFIIHEHHSVADFQKLKRKLHAVINDSNALVVFESAGYTLNELFLIEVKSIISSSCAHMILYDSELEMREVFTGQMIAFSEYEVIYSEERYKELAM